MAQNREWLCGTFDAKDQFRPLGPRTIMKTSIVTVSLASILLLFAGIGFGYVHPGSLVKGAPEKSSSPSNVTTLDPQFFPSLGSKRVKISYGPYSAYPSDVDNGMHTFSEYAAEKPCSDCIITWMQAGLEYPNGTYANANTGMWLHHIVLTNTDRPSSVCGMQYGGDRFFASGNERTAVNICFNGTERAGYYIGPNENVAMFVELMNENKDSRPVVATITYEFIPTVPPTFERVTSVWLDIGGCLDSEQPAKNDTVFEYSMQPAWKANFSGRITTILGHLHDGGTHLEVKQNNVTLCDTMATYGQSAGYNESTSGGMDMNGMYAGMDQTMSHLSSLTTCDMTGVVNVGDEWSVTAHYNTTKYQPMLINNGALEPIMGISIFYVAKGENASVSDNATGTASASSPTGEAPTALSSTSSSSSSSPPVSAGSGVRVVLSIWSLFMALTAILL